MSDQATATVKMRLERIVITKANGTTVDLGKPGTLGFQIRRRVYIWRNRKLLKGAH